ncbi:9234_t:CDS:2, partial [Racocetra fulgida]
SDCAGEMIVEGLIVRELCRSECVEKGIISGYADLLQADPIPN